MILFNTWIKKGLISLRMLVSGFVVRKPRRQGFSRRGPYIMTLFDLHPLLEFLNENQHISWKVNSTYCWNDVLEMWYLTIILLLQETALSLQIIQHNEFQPIPKKYLMLVPGQSMIVKTKWLNHCLATYMSRDKKVAFKWCMV